jgi:thiamine-phosphate pyrophosphorylase
VVRFPPLYAILDIDTLASRGLAPLDVLAAWLDAGVRLVQLRAKSMASGPMLELAERLRERAHSAGAVLIVNDRADVAMMAGADGVHVGQDDLTPNQARVACASHTGAAHRDFLVGLSTHSLEQFRDGLLTSSDYAAVGPIFPTASKMHPDPAVGLQLIQSAKAISGERAIVAIGGITLKTAPAVLAAGATSVAVISDLVNVGQVGQVVQVGQVGRRAREYVIALC